MIVHTAHLTKRELVRLRTAGELAYGGHRKNKIYGTLDCKGAKRWIARGHYVKQRVFFSSESEAINHGFRPCAQCMPERYRKWKKQQAVKDQR